MLARQYLQKKTSAQNNMCLIHRPHVRVKAAGNTPTDAACVADLHIHIYCILYVRSVKRSAEVSIKCINKHIHMYIYLCSQVYTQQYNAVI